MALILDTGPLYASLDRSDADHQACRRLIEQAQEPLVIPAPVLVEVDYWIHARLHPGVLVALLDDIDSGAYRVEDLHATDYARVRSLCDRYDDADIGFVDAAVLAIVERHCLSSSLHGSPSSQPPQGVAHPCQPPVSRWAKAASASQRCSSSVMEER